LPTEIPQVPPSDFEIIPGFMRHEAARVRVDGVFVFWAMNGFGGAPFHQGRLAQARGYSTNSFGDGA
jgi:hypothetical protein